MDQSTSEDVSPSRPLASILLPILAGISVVICLPPLVTHLESRNVAAAVLVFWITLINMFNFLNPLIWPTDELDDRWNGVGLCDIEVKLIVASSLAIPGALICIFRQLAIILDTDKTTLVPSRGQRRRRLAFEVVFCIVCPLYMMIGHYVVQSYRYYIFAISGCVPPFDSSWVGIILMFVPPLVLCAVAAGYSVLVVVRLLKYRRQFSTILASSQSKVNKSRFLRLFILSTTLIVVFLPIAIYVFTRNLEYPRVPYSWSKVHSAGWSELIIRVPTSGTVNFDRWLNVGTGYAVFLFFGFGSDATMMYRSWLLKLGFGRVFPKFHHPHLNLNHRTGSAARSSNATKVGSMSSRAKLIFHRKESAKTISTMQPRMDSDATYAVNHDSDRDMQSKTSGSNIWFKLPRLWPSREVETNHERLQPRLVVEKSFEDHPRPRSMAWSTLSPISPIEDKGSQESMKGAAN